MSTDMAQMNLREPEQVDWDALGSSSSYAPPPPALTDKGEKIIYYGVAAGVTETSPDDGHLQFLLDPIKIVRGGPDYPIRFTRVSTRTFTKKDAAGNTVAVKGNPNKLANFLRACGLQAKPQTNAEYRAAVAASKGKVFGFILDWEAYNKDTQEKVKGYAAFPDDPERPGQKKSILHAGDVVNELDGRGNIIGTRTVQSEVLFANARLRFFQDAKGTK